MIYLQRSKVLGAMEDHQQDQERKDFHWVQGNLFDIVAVSVKINHKISLITMGLKPNCKDFVFVL